MKRRTGAILFSALVIALIMMMWAVAAVYRANFQSHAALFSYQKSEVYYLAKRGISRSVYLMNNDPHWISSHQGKANADESTPDTRCWLEDMGGDRWVLRCEARVGTQLTTLSVPMLTEEDESSQFYSVAPDTGGGPDTVGVSSVRDGNWNSLPPIPGHPQVLSIAPTPNGDCYAIGSDGSQTRLWRYRKGQGWMQMPDVPGGVAISGLSAGGDAWLVCKGGDNSLMMLNLGNTPSTEMAWTRVDAPSGTTLTQVAAAKNGDPRAFASASSSGNPKLYQHDSGGWKTLPTPLSYEFDPTTGVPRLSSLLAPPNYDGGLASDTDGKLYVASNPPGSASVVQQFLPDAPGASTGTWKPLAPVMAIEWTGADTTANPTGYISNLSNLEVDPDGQLWAQWNSSPDNYSVVRIDPQPLGSP